MKTDFSYKKAAFRLVGGPEILPYTHAEFFAAVRLYTGMSETMQQALAEVMWQDACNIARQAATAAKEAHDAT